MQLFSKYVFLLVAHIINEIQKNKMKSERKASMEEK